MEFLHHVAKNEGGDRLHGEALAGHPAHGVGIWMMRAQAWIIDVAGTLQLVLIDTAEQRVSSYEMRFYPKVPTQTAKRPLLRKAIKQSSLL